MRKACSGATGADKDRQAGSALQRCVGVPARAGDRSAGDHGAGFVRPHVPLTLLVKEWDYFPDNRETI